MLSTLVEDLPFNTMFPDLATVRFTLNGLGALPGPFVKEKTMPPSKGGRDRFKGAIRRDKEDGKRYPNSVVALVRTICTQWFPKGKHREPGARRSVKSFVEDSGFDHVLFEVFDRFPKAAESSTISKVEDLGVRRKRIKNMLDSFGSSHSRRPPPFEYFHLRAFSDYLGVSESGFLIVTKLLSLERRIDDPETRRQAIMQMIEAHRRLLSEAEAMANADDFEGFAIAEGPHPKDKEREVWIANPDALHTLVDAFQREDLSEYEEAMDRL